MSTASLTPTRRTLLQSGVAAAAALVVGFEVLPKASAQDSKAKPAVNPLRAWIRMDADGFVTIFYPKSEMGQGISTALPMILAEELDLDWNKVRVEHAPVTEDYGSQGTGGSGSITALWTPLRQAGATARTMLVTAAAKQWKIAASECTTQNGAVLNGSKSLAYSDLVTPASQLPVPELATVQLKRREDYRYIGKPMARKDIPSKVDGSAVFGLDVRVPGMVYAVVARCPVFGGSLKTFDAAKAKAMKGVIDVFPIDAVKEGIHSCGGLAVVAESTWIAMQARKQLQIDWDFGPAAHESSETLRKQFRRLVDSQMKVIVNQGDAVAALSKQSDNAHRVECDYELPFQAHATMEPMNCTVHVRADGAEAWIPTQAPDMSQGLIAMQAKLPPEKIKVHTTYMGGGFGRRYQGDFVVEATQISRQIKRPVQLIWSREDDMTHDFYRPASYHRMSAVVDKDGNIDAWRHKATSTSIAEWFMPKAAPEATELGCTLQMPYLAKSYRLEYLPAASAVPRAWWRSVEASIIGFVMESFVDELAHAAGKDPYEFRMEKLGADRLVKNATEADARPLNIARLRNVLEIAAKNCDWGKPLPAGHGRGIAAHYSFNSYVSNCAEVEVSGGVVHVKRIVSAVDIGIPINPDGIRAQIESAIVYGLTAALKSQITIEGGRTVETNFNKFTTLSMKETPLVEVHIVPSTEPPTGIGEPGLPPTAPALANAIFAATGKRIRRLPIQSSDLA